MRYYLLLLVATTLIFQSCHEDTILTSIDEELENPTVVDGFFITGTITDMFGNPLRDTEVAIYQDGILIGTTYSDDEGSYTTASLDINPTLETILKYEKSDFQEKFRSFSFDQEEEIVKNVTLASEEVNASISESTLSTPLDTSLVLIYGYTRFSNGDPVAGVQCRSVWEFIELTSNFFIFQGTSADISDDDGYWEMYVPKDMSVFFQALFGFGDFGSTCRFDFAPVLPLAPNSLGQLGLPYIDLGQFQGDTEVITNPNVDLDLRNVTVSGKIERCDGSPIEAGSLTISLGQLFFEDLILPSETVKFEDYPFGPNGEFEVSLATCENTNTEWGVSVSAHDTIINWNAYQSYNYEEELDIGALNLCWDRNDYPGFIEVIIDQDTIITDNNYNDNVTSGIGTLLTGADKQEGEVRTSFFIAMEDIQVGENILTRLEMWHSQQEDSEGPFTVFDKPFNERPAMDAFAEITSIEDQWVEGYVDGKVNTTTGQKDIKVNFRIYDK